MGQGPKTILLGLEQVKGPEAQWPRGGDQVGAELEFHRLPAYTALCLSQRHPGHSWMGSIPGLFDEPPPGTFWDGKPKGKLKVRGKAT